mmetsp:Transcript_17574/g.24680  ORF Transcript_17574/g.24680 Transcript_17574/m.24680 type:complete len:200 (-) Transcript_17574:73-672(-)
MVSWALLTCSALRMRWRLLSWQLRMFCTATVRKLSRNTSTSAGSVTFMSTLQKLVRLSVSLVIKSATSPSPRALALHSSSWKKGLNPVCCETGWGRLAKMRQKSFLPCSIACTSLSRIADSISTIVLLFLTASVAILFLAPSCNCNHTCLSSEKGSWGGGSGDTCCSSTRTCLSLRCVCVSSDSGHSTSMLSCTSLCRR